ncbi:hypothetical protein GALMADRAFT_1291642 [Galerina marginata CBS 339.88]|uniref:Uncharacterized protein n=1 Tax=Galerina marginata (strain CBS 339.88) TaxID=685588 RepID=A0A067SFC8_GALM3|nr:hypothetical protein GALMADRAFT_1291642 [Galerina marginata CBS 339.88]
MPLLIETCCSYPSSHNVPFFPRRAWESRNDPPTRFWQHIRGGPSPIDSFETVRPIMLTPLPTGEVDILHPSKQLLPTRRLPPLNEASPPAKTMLDLGLNPEFGTTTHYTPRGAALRLGFLIAQDRGYGWVVWVSRDLLMTRRGLRVRCGGWLDADVSRDGEKKTVGKRGRVLERVDETVKGGGWVGHGRSHVEKLG